MLPNKKFNIYYDIILRMCFNSHGHLYSFYDCEPLLQMYLYNQKDDGQSEICEVDVKTEPTEIADFELENRNHGKPILGP